MISTSELLDEEEEKMKEEPMIIPERGQDSFTMRTVPSDAIANGIVWMGMYYDLCVL